MNKDWVGNKFSVYNNLAASNHSDVERETNDFYATNPKALTLLLDKLKEDNIRLNHNIWEPACGQGHLSEVLRYAGYNVYSSDLVNRGYGIANVNFLEISNRPLEESFDILTNPPYKYAEDFVNKSLELLRDGEHCIMFLKIQFLEGKSRYKLYQENPPKYVYVHSSRQTCAMNGEFIQNGKEIGSAVCYAWYIWEKGFKGDTIIRWIK